MTDALSTILVVDPDARTRSLLAEQLRSPHYAIIAAGDGPNALHLVHTANIRVVVTELYLPTGEDECLIHAIRRDRGFRKTRVVAHTRRSQTADREWAMRAGADAYLIKPTRAERMRHVVSRLASASGSSSAVPVTTTGPMVRRDSLDAALQEIEGGALTNTSCIVFGRVWWDQLPPGTRSAYRKRAKIAQVNLRSDSMLAGHFVEVRGESRGDIGLSTERPESPFRR